jgi:hypothetical protein
VCAQIAYDLATSNAFTARNSKSLAQSPMHIVEAQTGQTNTGACGGINEHFGSGRMQKACHDAAPARCPSNACLAEGDHIAQAFMMQNLKGSSCTVENARQYVPITPVTFELARKSYATGRFLKQRPKILHFSGRGVGGSAAAAGCHGAAVDAGIQLADGVLASRDFSCVDLSRCVCTRGCV